MAPTIRALSVYVPAKNFELSKSFYAALGFRMTEVWGDTVDCELGGHRFRLQNYYVKAWADNCMMVLDIDDVEQWHERARSVLVDNRFPGARFTPPETAGESRVLHVWDPTGVLLVFVQ